MFRTMFAGTRSSSSSWMLSPSPSLRHSSSFSFDDDEDGPQPYCSGGAKERGPPGETMECLKLVAMSREIAEHGMREYQMGDRHVLAIKLFGEVHLVEGICPNCGARLIQGCLSQHGVICPRHGSLYDIRTGLFERGVGFHSLRVYESHSIGGKVFVKYPLEKFGRRCELPVMRVCPRRYDYLGIANRPIVIVGAGISAISCAITLREKGYSGRLLLICREHWLPYDRKSLSKRLPPPAGRQPPFGLFLDHPNLYDQLSLEMMLGVNVREVLPREKAITLEGNSRHGQMEYAYLVLAMGAVHKKLALKADMDREALYLRTLDDAKRVAAETAGKSVAIVGSGMLGIELASTLRKTAKSVILFGKLASSLAIFGEDVRAEILDWLHESGVSVMRNSSAYDFERFGNRIQICFKKIATGLGLCAIADKLVGAIGIMPCTSNLMKANIRMDPKGFVLVDERMRTSQPGVLACGDCVSVPASGGQRMSWPHWQMAQHQGKLAAQTILGIPQGPGGGGGAAGEHHQPAVPFLWLDLPDRHLTFAGWPLQRPDEHIQLGSIRDNNLIGYHFKNGNVVAVVSCGPTNLAIQFLDIFARDLKISKERVLRNHHHSWTNYSA